MAKNPPKFATPASLQPADFSVGQRITKRQTALWLKVDEKLGRAG